MDNRQTLAEAPAISHLLETSLYVADLACSKNFYQSILNLPLIFEDHRMCSLAVPGSGVLLLFKHDASLAGSHMPGGFIPPHGGSGQLHLCFAIPLPSLAGWQAHLRAKKVAIESQVTQHFGGTSLYFRDPDGHSIELAVPGLWPSY